MKHLKLLTRLILSIWAITSMLIYTASSDFVNNACYGILQLQTENTLESTTALYDFTTGITLHQEQDVSEAHLISPDANYRYDIPWYTGNDNDVFLISDNGTHREQIYSSPFITSVLWASDSQSLLIWEFDGTREVTSVTSLDIHTQEHLFRHEFPPTLGRRRLASPDNRYIYAQYPLDVMQFTHGVVFVDTLTGAITRFAEPSEFPYIWSENNTWVATTFQDTFAIINPQIGDFHPNLLEPITGAGFVWQGDDYIWYTRAETIWRMNLNTATEHNMLNNATLINLSADASWATNHNPQTDDIELYHFASNRHYPLNLSDKLLTYRVQVAYSPDNACGAVLITSYRNPSSSTLRIINLQTMRITHQQTLTPHYHHLDWIQID